MKKLILVAGVAGSGKSYIGREIAKNLDNCVYLDKDTQTRDLVDAMLFQLGRDDTDRESNEYREHVRPLEYSCLIKQAVENIELGNNVVVSAPFIKEIHEDEYFSDLEDQLEFEDAELVVVWIRTDESSARKRIIDRNARRDEHKIRHWNEYVQKISHKTPKNTRDMIVIDNRQNPDLSVYSQISNLIETLSVRKQQ